MARSSRSKILPSECRPASLTARLGVADQNWCFDSFGDRSDLLFNLDTIVAFAQKTQKEAASGQTDLFGMLGDESADVQPTMQLQPAPAKHTNKERLMWERELMGCIFRRTRSMRMKHTSVSRPSH
ncbi:hypothetical protein GWK76_03115 [Candidatus Saccharibacteria bacterium oral taxon 488]|nr:hypothetical protein GWK76_03115 [Candidatus Saccharibacteria bacterium oral taxon 488]